MSQETTDIATVLATLRQKARESQGSPEPLLKGTYAMYPMEDGGVMVVSTAGGTDSDVVQYTRIPATLITAVAALAGRGGKMKALKALMGGGKDGR